MRLKTNIFLWVFWATFLPLSALVLGATAYSERLYRTSVAQDVNSSLSSILSEIDRSLYYERQLVLSLASAPDMRQYLPVLERAAQGELHPTFFERGERLKEFLKALQGVVPNFHTLRVLDLKANTMVKVSFARSAVGTQEGIESMPYAENELDDDRFARRLSALPANELSFVQLPESRWDRDGVRGPPMLSAVVPLIRDDAVVGYLLADYSGEQIDRILELASRAHGATLLLAEISPDESDRDGAILYDDRGGLRMTRADALPANLRAIDRGRMWKAVQRKPYGDLLLADGRSRIYYAEYLPYPNQLVSWVLAARVGQAEISAPFNRIRFGIFVFAAMALLISLWLAHVGARNVAAPIVSMATTLKNYADGNRDARVQTAGADELRQLGNSFNYMAETLARARDERDQAQSMMLQSAKLASIGQMAAGIGHEINNPLNNILSYAKLIGRSLPEDAQGVRRDLDSLREEALRASAIIRSVLNFARQVPPHYTRFSVAPWVHETISLVQQAAAERRIQLQQLIEVECELDGDRHQLQQVLVNLLLNAIQASPAGGTVTVHVRCDAAALELEVRDRGPGIAEPNMARVYDPFFTTKAVGEGSGLGLSISLGIIEHHNGTLSLENQSDGGVAARIHLPLRRHSGSATRRSDTV